MEEIPESDRLIEKGARLLRDNNPLAALACFEKACALKKTPVSQSYLGLCLASERGRIAEGTRLCLEAIDADPNTPLHYLNLGKIYLKTGRKTVCLEVLRRGLSAGDHPEIRELLERIGRRKPPVFSCLPRGHFLNRYAGLILSRLGLR